MRKSAPALTLVAALTASLGGCDDPADQVQRDVYSGPDAYERCVADWGNEDLCQRRADDAEKKALAQKQGGGGHDSNSIFIWGPAYSGGSRYVDYGGQQYVPKSTGATSTSTWLRDSGGSYKPTSFSAPKPAFTGTPSTRGGFGATGTRVSGGGAS